MTDLIKAVSRVLPARRGTSRAGPIRKKRFIAGGELLPPGIAGVPYRQKWDSSKAVELGYKRSSLVFSAISAIASASASVPWLAEVKKSEDEWEPDESHPLTLLMKQPHKFQSRQEFIERISQSMGITGNAIIRKNILSSRSGEEGLSPVSEMHTLPTEGLAVIPSKTEWISGYIYEKSVPPVTYDVDEIMHVQFPDPEDPYWGMSPLLALSRIVDTHEESIEWNMVSMLKRAVADGVFTTKEELTRPEYDEIKQEIKEQKQGSDVGHDIWVVGSGFEYHEMSRSPVEMDFTESMSMYRELLLSGFHVPPVQAGFFDEATLANAEVSRKLFWLDAIIPNYLDRIKNVFNRSLVPHFGDSDTLRLVYVTTEVDALRENTLEQAKIFVMLIKNGVPYNESAKIVGLTLENQKNGDIPFGVRPPSVEQIVNQAEKNVVKALIRSKAIQPGFVPLVQVKRDPDVVDLLLGDVDKFRADIESEFLAVIQDHESSVNVAGIETALRMENFQSLIAAYDLVGLEEKYARIIDGLERAATGGGERAIEKIREETGVEIEWDRALITGWLATHGEELITQITDSSRTGIQKMWDMFQEGILGENIEDIGAIFAVLYGINSLQSGALGSFASDLGIADPDIGREAALGPRIERMARALLKNRGANVGSHQSSLSYFQGQNAAWDHAVRSQTVTTQVRKTWFDANDADVCPICLSLDGQTILQGQRFFSPVTNLSYTSPGEPHPDCRCAVVTTTRQSVL